MAIICILDLTYAKFVSGEAYFYTENIPLLRIILSKDKFDELNDYLKNDQAGKIWDSGSSMDRLHYDVEKLSDLISAEPRGDIVEGEPIQGINYRELGVAVGSIIGRYTSNI